MADPRSARRRSFVADLQAVNLEPYDDGVAVEALDVKPDNEEPFAKKDDGTFACNLCGKVYKQVGYMKKHLSSNHDINDQVSLKCNKCEKMFDTKKKLTRHEKMKTDCRKLV